MMIPLDCTGGLQCTMILYGLLLSKEIFAGGESGSINIINVQRCNIEYYFITIFRGPLLLACCSTVSECSKYRNTASVHLTEWKELLYCDCGLFSLVSS